MFVIVFGDLDCVEKIVVLMDKLVKLVFYCEFIIWCVELDGKFVIVCFIGIGGLFIFIVVEELVQLGICIFLCIGIMGVIQLYINVGDVLVIMVFVCLDGVSLYFVLLEFLVVVDFECMIVLVEVVKFIGVIIYVGVIVFFDIFYSGQECYDIYFGCVVCYFKGFMEEWQVMGVMNYEMEFVILLIMCVSQGLCVGMVVGVIVNCIQ